MMNLDPTPNRTTAAPAAALPDTETCFAALNARDRSFNGRFFFAVKTTGVYCLPSCGARTPRRENVSFYPSCEAAERAGFRSCKRCRPREWQADSGLSSPVARACRLLDRADVDERPNLVEIARKVGLSPGTLTRRFQRELGLAPRDWLAARKHGRFRAALRAGDNVSDALYGAGFGSTSRVYESSDRTLGMTPATYRRGGLGAEIDYAIVDSDYGRLLVAATGKGICAVCLGEDDRRLEQQLAEDFPAADIRRSDAKLGPRAKAVLARLYGRKPTAMGAPDVPLDISGTAFQWKVWRALTEIPEGTTLTYSEIATKLGQPGAARAVGRACATNPVAIVVPCHRAVGTRGALTGYRWGVERKRRLLDAEKKRAAG
jgi:AraC family transcriptional regulator of adaptative response/methylated-DNA-[protein]-cysteine methyltransferase